MNYLNEHLNSIKDDEERALEITALEDQRYYDYVITNYPYLIKKLSKDLRSALITLNDQYPHLHLIQLYNDYIKAQIACMNAEWNTSEMMIGISPDEIESIYLFNKNISDKLSLLENALHNIHVVNNYDDALINSIIPTIEKKRAFEYKLRVITAMVNN